MRIQRDSAHREEATTIEPLESGTIAGYSVDAWPFSRTCMCTSRRAKIAKMGAVGCVENLILSAPGCAEKAV